MIEVTELPEAAVECEECVKQEKVHRAGGAFVHSAR
jgi:hypothetical protein